MSWILASSLFTTALLQQLPVGQNSYQVGALYTGGDNSRPRLNKANCGSFGADPAVDFQLVVNVQGFQAIPVGVLYTEDVPIPARIQQPTTPTGTPTAQQLVSAVSCTEPVAANIIRDNIPIIPGASRFQLSQYYLNAPSVSDVMRDLCENADGGVRKRRAYCLGVRNGQGATTQVRGGDGPDIDTVAPGPPAGILVESGDAYLTVTLVPPPGSDAVESANMRYVVQARECDVSSFADGGWPDAGPAPGDGGVAPDALAPFCRPWADVTGPTTSPVTVGRLRNSATYEVRAYAVDDFDNVGPVGGSAFGSPIKEYGILDLYGGQVYGGSCSSAGGGTLVAVAGAVWMVLSVARRRRGRSERGAEP